MNSPHPSDNYFMRMAFRLAHIAVGYTAPNPPVGAVLVLNHRVIASGYHFKAGTPHAEQWVIKKAGEKARGATLYVTLEPCNHRGRTPPCTHLIVDAGIQRVVYSVDDPNPEVTGGGGRWLEEHGIEVTSGVLSREGQSLIAGFRSSLLKRRPYTLLKIAVTLNGIVGHRYQRLIISSPATLGLVQELRATCDAILVGSGTVLNDRPSLTPRTRWLHPDKLYYRCVLDSHLRTPEDAPCYNDDTPVVIFHASDVRPDPVWHKNHRYLVPVRSNEGGLDLSQVLEWLADHDVHRCLVEPGPTLLKTFLKHPEYIDELWILSSVRVVDRLGNDFLAVTGLSSIPWQIIDYWQFGDDHIWRLKPPASPL